MQFKYLDITGQFRSVEDEVEVDWHNMSTNDKKPHHVRKNRKNGYHYAHNPETTVIKPNVEHIVKSHKKNIVQVLRKLSENGLDVSSRDCICSREACSIVCLGKDCNYSFTGRLTASCVLHPGDKYLMDHSPLCPQCKGRLGRRFSFHLMNNID